MSKSQDPNKVSLGEVFALITSNKALFWVVVLVTGLIIAVLCGIAYHNQQKTIKKHELLKDNGVLILATSYREHCGKNAKRFYRFDVNGKSYIKSVGMFCGKPLGDTVEVYYLKDKPHINLFKTQLQRGVPSHWHSVFMIIVCTCLLLFLTVFDFLPSLKGGDSCSQTAKPDRKNVP
ncbi:hypothetical protein E6P74_10790, partial [Moraxella lacunata]|uniref:hypothetical protein n=1 Tax=Moraxella lacunata TaxID=477 RepID=UPI0024A63C73